jgi:hypothetical protein
MMLLRLFHRALSISLSPSIATILDIDVFIKEMATFVIATMLRLWAVAIRNTISICTLPMERIVIIGNG